MNKILIVNVNWVGDVIFSSPIFKALKKKFSQSHIACLAVPRVKDILESIPELDEIIIYDEKGIHKDPFSKLKLIQSLKGRKFDAAFLLHRSLTRALFVFFAGIPIRVGYAAKGRGIFLTHKVKSLAKGAHRSDHYLNVIESFGIPVTDRRCHLAVNAEAKRFVDEIFKKEGIGPQEPFIVLNPGGNWDLKRWPLDKFSQLIDRLYEEFKLKIIIAGAKQDIELVDTIVQRARFKPIVLTGQTDLKQLMAMLAKADLVISADSGPLHIANAVGTKTIGLFGPTRPEVTGPRGMGHSVILQKDVGCNQEPCYNLDCPDNICMRSISVEEVVHEVRRLKG